MPEEILTTPHPKGHRLRLSDVETVTHLDEEIQRLDDPDAGEDEDFEKVYVMCRCLDCNAPVTVTMKLIEQELVLDTERLGL